MKANNNEPPIVDDVFTENERAQLKKYRARSEREWARFVRDHNKYREWERQVNEMFNVCNRILADTGLWGCVDWVVDKLHRLQEEFLRKTHTLRTVLRLAIGWQSPSLFYESVGVREAIAYLFDWRGARERHALKWSGEQLRKEIWDIDLQNKIKR